MRLRTRYFKTLAKQAAPVVVPTAPMPPTYSLLSPPPVSPTYGDRLEVSVLTPGAQGPGLVSPSKMRQSIQFGLGATSGAGNFPCTDIP